MRKSASNSPSPPTVALVAHDAKKDALTAFCVRNRGVLDGWRLIATGTTGMRVSEATGLPVQGYLSGPLGGDAQIAGLVAEGKVAAVIFIVDPLNAHPHDPDIQTLQRVCNVHNVAIATNLATAELILHLRMALSTRMQKPQCRNRESSKGRGPVPGGSSIRFLSIGARAPDLHYGFHQPAPDWHPEPGNGISGLLEACRTIRQASRGEPSIITTGGKPA